MINLKPKEIELVNRLKIDSVLNLNNLEIQNDSDSDLDIKTEHEGDTTFDMADIEVDNEIDSK